MADERTYIHVLTESELQEIKKGLELFKCKCASINTMHDLSKTRYTLALGRSFYDVTKESFPLDSLGPDLESFSWAVHYGAGFFVLKGLEPAKFSQEDNISIYLGISSYFGERRAQQYPDGRMLSIISVGS